MIAIVDYGAGNLKSVRNAFDYLKADSLVANKPEDIEGADRVILPGVGTFGFMMDGLRKRGLEGPIKEAISEGKPFLGICLGLQGLFDESGEGPGSKGLGIFKGKVVRYRSGKVPQIGWNKVVPAKEGLLENGYAYFVNSYYPIPRDKDIIAATSDYYGKFACAVQKDNVIAVQFHPERSGDFGINFLRRWLRC